MLEQRSPYHLLRDLVIAQRLLVEDPKMKFVAGLILSGDKRAAIRTIENCGTVAVYWRCNGDASAASFHGVLKACTLDDDGTGGFVDLSRFQGDIYVAPATGSAIRVTAFEALPLEGQS